MKNLLNFTAIYQLNKTKATSDLVECLTVLDILDIDIRLTFLSPDKTPEEFHEMMIAYKQCADRLLDCVESAIKGGEITRLQGSEIIMENSSILSVANKAGMIILGMYSNNLVDVKFMTYHLLCQKFH